MGFRNLVTLVAFVFLSSSSGGQTLTDVANKEKNRRKQNASEGKTNKESWTNVIMGVEKPLEDGEYLYTTNEEYEEHLDGIVGTVKGLREKWQMLWRDCSNKPYEMVEERYQPQVTRGEAPSEKVRREEPSSQDWWMFTVQSVQNQYVDRWSVSCRSTFEDLRTLFESGRRRYDFVYREYGRFLTESGESGESGPRQLPRPQ